MAKRNLRKQMRKEQFIDRNKFYNDVMDNPGTVVFHKLINRNRHSDTACITEQSTNHYTTEDQTTGACVESKICWLELKIIQGMNQSYYPCHFNRYFPCQNVDRTQIAY
jgi:hypothetical protein